MIFSVQFAVKWTLAIDTNLLAQPHESSSVPACPQLACDVVCCTRQWLDDHVLVGPLQPRAKDGNSNIYSAMSRSITTRHGSLANMKQNGYITFSVANIWPTFAGAGFGLESDNGCGSAAITNRKYCPCRNQVLNNSCGRY